jgi:hypothetical protein
MQTTQMKTLTVVLLSLAFLPAAAQFSISNTDEIEHLKKGTLYVVMKDPASVKAANYVKVFHEVWTFSKIAFIKPGEVANYYADGNFFFTLSNERNTTYSGGGGGSYKNAYYFLELWKPTAKYLKGKKNKEPEMRDMVQLARIELYPDFSSIKDHESLFREDYDWGGRIRNWGPGMLKNYLQNLVQLLEKGKKLPLGESIRNKEKLPQLAAGTLLIPDYVLIKFNMFTGDESQRHTEEDITKDYGYKTKFVSTQELNNLILTDKKGFYYLCFVKSSAWKFVTIIHSLTGEVIFSELTTSSYNLKSGDLKDVRKAIEK